MKKVILFFTLLMGVCLSNLAQEIKLVPSADDSTRMDTVVTSTLADTTEKSTSAHFFDDSHFDIDEDIVSIVAIITVFGVPVFIVALVLWFRYKNKQAQYRLAAEALAQGKELPKNFYRYENPNTQHQEVLKKGISNVFLGIGLGVFLWILTHEERLAAIGFLIFCIGLGQVIIAYATRPRDTDQSHSTDIEKR